MNTESEPFLVDRDGNVSCKCGCVEFKVIQADYKTDAICVKCGARETIHEG